MEARRKSIHTSRYKRLRELLVAARRSRGLTQSGLALALGKPQSYVSKVESGERRLDIVELLDFLRALDYDEASFMKALVRRQKGPNI